jgi:glycosyltransferase involved in cell wall biosynthesis
VKGRLAYVLSRYPKLSETFVADEIAALERRGTPVAVYALRSGHGVAATRPAVVPGILEIVAAQLVWGVRAPGRLLGVWAAVARHRGSLRQLAEALHSVAAAAALALRLRRSGVTHVHAHFATHAALAAWAIRRLTGISYSFTPHADDLFVRRPMLAEKVADAAFVVAISAFNRRHLTEALGAAATARVRVLHCGVPTAMFPVLPPSSARPFTILCVGRLEEKKGQLHLIEACRHLLARGVDFRCVLVGDGAQRAALERARGAAGLGDRVALLGAQPRERVRALLGEAHAFALPSVVAPDGRAEGIPVALMEAMASGRPVVSTRTSGIPELIEHDRSGLLVAPGDAVALADALGRLHADPGLAASLAERGARAVRARFDLDTNVDRLARLFDGVADAADGGVPAAALGLEAGVGGGRR